MSVAAVVTGVKRQISKKTGKEYARLVLEDFHGTAEAIVFPDAWAKLNQIIVPDAALLLTGGYSDRDRGEDQAPFIVETARPLDELKSSGAVGAEPAVALPVRAASRRRCRRSPPCARRTPGPRRSILNGATATARRFGSGPGASAWRRKTTSFGLCATCWAPNPSTTSRRDEPDGLCLHAGLREAAAGAGAADRRSEAHRERAADRHRRASCEGLQGKLDVAASRHLPEPHPAAAGHGGPPPPPAVHARLPQHHLHRLHRAARRPALHGRSGHRRRLGPPGRRLGDGDRPPEGPRHQGEPEAQLRHAAPRGLPEGAPADEARGQVRRAGHHADRHARRLSRAGRRGAGPVGGAGPQHPRDVGAPDALRRRGHRRGRLGRRAGARAWPTGC